LRCSVSRQAAQLASLTAFAALRQPAASQSTKRAAARLPQALRCSAPNRRAPACPHAPLLNPRWPADGGQPRVDLAAGAARWGRFGRRREAQRQGAARASALREL